MICLLFVSHLGFDFDVEGWDYYPRKIISFLLLLQNGFYRCIEKNVSLIFLKGTNVLKYNLHGRVKNWPRKSRFIPHKLLKI